MASHFYLSIGELADRSGIAQSALRFYEQKGLIFAERTPGNQRRYHSSMLRRISLVRVAQSVGFTLEEITAELAALPMDRVATQKDWQRLAERWQAELTARLARLQSLKDNLTGCIGCGCLSMEKCQLFNPEDSLCAEGKGPRRIAGY
ncbi:redox-sensitive transcriptional activator SoxR [Gallaecimonas xiamenensis]|uniref:Redox-sensitive transcriptional activator SoxR n=1 Tax=Gallaecimonas xiamenensis 3-C-1 TaxID=745411 RepID=K2JH81_9GAMM|nr:redox-sensitive transcriptional activator SoxR [Gallaecimonas xiamenensis]EKE73937.1 redox-sensitive transcriptional activator soxR [Gallaecimonas xiamenensis 3-C-1]